MPQARPRTVDGATFPVPCLAGMSASLGNSTDGLVITGSGAPSNTVGGTVAGAANMFQNNALGTIQVLVNGLPPSGDATRGNTIGGNTFLAPRQANLSA